MKAITLTQPWAGLVASGIKLVENRPRAIIRIAWIAERPQIAIHASREIDKTVYPRIAEIAPDVLRIEDGKHIIPCKRFWPRLADITSAVIAVATVREVLHIGGTDPAVVRRALERLGIPDQERFVFGPTVYVLSDAIALATPVACRGHLGCWKLPDEVELAVRDQLPVAA